MLGTGVISELNALYVGTGHTSLSLITWQKLQRRSKLQYPDKSTNEHSSGP